jgi:hypothetical protein
MNLQHERCVVDWLVRDGFGNLDVAELEELVVDSCYAVEGLLVENHDVAGPDIAAVVVEQGLAVVGWEFDVAGVVPELGDAGLELAVVVDLDVGLGLAERERAAGPDMVAALELAGTVAADGAEHTVDFAAGIVGSFVVGDWDHLGCIVVVGIEVDEIALAPADPCVGVEPSPGQSFSVFPLRAAWHIAGILHCCKALVHPILSNLHHAQSLPSLFAPKTPHN